MENKKKSLAIVLCLSMILSMMMYCVCDGWKNTTSETEECQGESEMVFNQQVGCKCK